MKSFEYLMKLSGVVKGLIVFDEYFIGFYIGTRSLLFWDKNSF